MTDFSAIDDKVNWEEVADEEENHDIESKKNDVSKQPLLTKNSDGSNGSRLQNQNRISKQELDSFERTQRLFASIPIWMGLMNVGVLIVSLVGDMKAESSGESCIYPLSYYLRAAALHASINVLLSILYFIRLTNKIFYPDTNNGVSAHEKQDFISPLMLGDGLYDYMLEKTIIFMFICQIILGIVGEFYFGGLSIGPAWLSSCLRKSPAMYSYSVGVSLYENAIVLILIIFLVRKFI